MTPRQRLLLTLVDKLPFVVCKGPMGMNASRVIISTVDRSSRVISHSFQCSEPVHESSDMWAISYPGFGGQLGDLCRLVNSYCACLDLRRIRL